MRALSRAAPSPRIRADGVGVGGSRDYAPYALVVARLAPEKGVDVAIAACRLAGIALVVAGDGPELPALRELAGDGDVRFAGRVDDAELARLRAGASVALVPSRSAETFGMAAAEAMAAGLPVAASAVGALAELLDEVSLAPPGDAPALAGAIARVRADPDSGRRGLERVGAVCAPDVVARELAAIYDGVPPGPSPRHKLRPWLRTHPHGWRLPPTDAGERRTRRALASRGPRQPAAP